MIIPYRNKVFFLIRQVYILMWTIGLFRIIVNWHFRIACLSYACRLARRIKLGISFSSFGNMPDSPIGDIPHGAVAEGSETEGCSIDYRLLMGNKHMYVHSCDYNC